MKRGLKDLNLYCDRHTLLRLHPDTFVLGSEEIRLDLCGFRGRISLSILLKKNSSFFRQEKNLLKLDGQDREQHLCLCVCVKGSDVSRERCVM